MKIVMILLALIGALIFGAGLSAYIEAINSGEVINTFLGMLFSFGMMILGAVLLIVDLIIFVIYRARKKQTTTT